MSNQVEYEKDVRDAAESIIEELRGDPEREPSEVIHETLDCCGRVIYTYKAQQGLAESKNDGAYADNYGAEGMVTDGCINWSGLMYAAMEQDVYEELDRMGFDINDPETWAEEE